MGLNKFDHIEEPQILFGFRQKTQDPRDGLLLFGPNEIFTSYSVEAGIVGTEVGIDRYKTFVTRLSNPIITNSIQWPSFPGFEAVFNVKWVNTPVVVRKISTERIRNAILNNKPLKKKVFDAVELYIEQIKYVKEHAPDARPNIWFLIIPREIYIGCRPKSKGKKNLSEAEKFIKSKKGGQTMLEMPEMEEYVSTVENILAISSDFHNLLKARLIKEKIDVPVQVLVETTLEFRDKLKRIEYKDNMKAYLAWTISSTIYYKLGKVPWKLADIRKGVCYLGLVYKKFEFGSRAGYVCSAAQMFLDSGDGSVFRGEPGDWKSEDKNEYHLNETAAEDILTIALNYYHDVHNEYPKEIFIHGRALFQEKEWTGFQKALKTLGASSTKLIGIVIKEHSNKLKIFREAENQLSRYGPLRGLALKISEREAYIWTRGFIPRLNTMNCKELPNPLRVIIDRGEDSIDKVLSDILALTKLNYNACLYGDGLPVTLRFSDNIGGILTAIDGLDERVRQFRYYI